MADEAKTASTPAPEPNGSADEQIRRLEKLLDEGLDDIDAGRTVSRDEMRREIEALLAGRKPRKTGTR
jgi:hypothetical protein